MNKIIEVVIARIEMLKRVYKIKSPVNDRTFLQAVSPFVGEIFCLLAGFDGHCGHGVVFNIIRLSLPSFINISIQINIATHRLYFRPCQPCDLSVFSNMQI